MSTKRYIYVDTFTKHVSHHALEAELEVPKFLIMYKVKVARQGLRYVIIYFKSQMVKQLSHQKPKQLKYVNMENMVVRADADTEVREVLHAARQQVLRQIDLGMIAVPAILGLYAYALSKNILSKHPKPPITRFKPLNKEQLQRAINIHDLKNGLMKTWDTSEITDMSNLFIHFQFTEQHDISEWNVSEVLNMDDMFKNSNINQSLKKWDVSNVTSMKRMFFYCQEFNQNLNGWGAKTSKVKLMNNMFSGCFKFNQPLNDWCVISVTNMEGMFLECRQFDQPLNKWDVIQVKNMQNMFNGCKKFNQSLNEWGNKTIQVTNMEAMFSSCEVFNSQVDQWDVSRVTNMKNMFNRCTRFDQPLNNWADKTRNVTSMKGMFLHCKAFNQPVDQWNTLDLTNTQEMFAHCDKFNQSFNRWGKNTKHITNMNYMFYD